MERRRSLPNSTSWSSVKISIIFGFRSRIIWNAFPLLLSPPATASGSTRCAPPLVPAIPDFFTRLLLWKLWRWCWCWYWWWWWLWWCSVFWNSNNKNSSMSHQRSCRRKKKKGGNCFAELPSGTIKVMTTMTKPSMRKKVKKATQIMVHVHFVLLMMSMHLHKPTMSLTTGETSARRRHFLWHSIDKTS